MAATKTTAGTQDFASFASAVVPENRRAETLILDSLFRAATGFAPVLWGPSIVGYGRYDYRYDSGREGSSLATGFSPRKDAISVYIMPGYADFGALLARLGPHRTGKSCLYIRRLAAVDEGVLREMIRAGLEDLARYWPVHPV